MTETTESVPAVLGDQVPDPKLREKALRIAELMVDQAFEGRRGHGGGPCSYRNLTRQELMVYLVLAFEYGSRYEARR